MSSTGSTTRRGLMGVGLGTLALGPALAQTATTDTPPGPASPATPATATASGATDPTAAMLRPMPVQRTATEGVADLGDVKLAYWDTGAPRDAGENAPTIILLHPATGSHLVWGYQQPALFDAGYRVIGYSRRGYFGSDTGPENTGTGAGDLLKLADHLKVGRFHAVGSAGGAIVATDLALSQPQRLRSTVLACTIMGVQDEAYLKQSAALRPRGFAEMPGSFREIGPSYRAANPDGVAAWEAMEHKAIPGGRRINQRTQARITWAALKAMTVPTLLIGGDADLWSPPAMTRMFQAAIPGSEAVIIAEAGHSAHWEQPEAFNAAVLGFLAKHR